MTVRRPVRPVMSEASLMRHVLEAAALGGWLYFHTHDSRRSPAGFPDLVMVRDRVLYAELKAQSGVVSADQAVWISRLALAGAEVYVWRPADIDAIDRILLARPPKEPAL